MKTTLKLFGTILLLVALATACRDLMTEYSPERELSAGMQISDFEVTDYYWCEGERIPIQRMDDKFYAVFYSADEERFRNELSQAGIELSSGNLPEQREFASHLFYAAGSGNRTFTNYKTAIIEGNYENVASALSSALYWAPYYRIADGDEIGMTEMILVKLKSTTTLAQLEKLANENYVEVLGVNEYRREWYYLACTNRSKGNSLEMANLFYASGLFEEAAPDFIVNVRDDQPNCINELDFANGILWHLGNNPSTTWTHINYCAMRGLYRRDLAILRLQLLRPEVL